MLGLNEVKSYETFKQYCTEKEEFCKQLLTKKSERELPSVIGAIAKYGAFNISMTKRDYHGRYEDDDCYFEYYNNVTGEYFEDEWSTRFAAPSFGLYEHVWFKQAYDYGYVDKNKIFETVKKRLANKYMKVYSYDLSSNFKHIAHMGLPVNVFKGRKFRGNAYLVDTDILSFCYNMSYLYGILITEDFEIHRIKYDNIKFDFESDAFNKFVEASLTAIDNATVDDITINVSGSKVVFGLEVGFMEFSEYVHLHYGNVDMVNEYARILAYQQATEKESEMQRIREWVAKNTDKTGEDAERLAEHIYRKNHG